jgi:ubiquinone biosynthesis monooxygenase Coq7
VRDPLVVERRHGETALDAGGKNFPEPVKRAMAEVARVMTRSSYRV